MKKTQWVVGCLLAALAVSWLPGSRAQTGAPAKVNFSFDQVEIRLLAKLVGDLTGRRFVLDSGVTGKVTIISPAPIPVEEAYPLFVSVLEAHGYSVVEQDNMLRIVPLPAKDVPGAKVVGPGEPLPEQGLVTRILRVEHISAIELKKIIEPLVAGGKTGAVAAFGPTNHLLLTDTAENVRRLERIIAELDRKGASSRAEFIPLKHAAPEEVTAQLMAALRGMDSAGATLSRHIQQVAEGAGSLPAEVAILPAPSARGVVLVGTPVQVTELRRIVEMMDVEPTSDSGRLRAIFLKYLSAEEAAKSLNGLLAKTAEKDQRQRIAIEPNMPNNALLVESSPQDFEIVRRLVNELDQVPQQVLVEILIAEVNVGKNLDFGVEWATIDSPKDGRTTVLGRSRPGDTDQIMSLITEGVVPQGLSVGVARGTYVDAAGLVQPRIPFLVQALAQKQDVRILSSIPLWAQNNTEASLSVVENIPVLRSTIEGGSGASRDVIQNIDRVDVGIKLKLTPHVNPDKEVLMQLNPSIEAILDEGPADMFAPTIAKREVSTTVTVPDKATIIISGLIREDRIKKVSKVPILGDIPLIKYLFRREGDKVQRTNLMIFVTPHIVTDIQAAAGMTREMEERANLSGVATNLDARPRRSK